MVKGSFKVVKGRPWCWKGIKGGLNWGPSDSCRYSRRYKRFEISFLSKMNGLGFIFSNRRELYLLIHTGYSVHIFWRNINPFPSTYISSINGTQFIYGCNCYIFTIIIYRNIYIYIYLRIFIYLTYIYN